MHLYGGALPLLCWLGVVACIALRTGGVAGVLLGLLASTWIASMLWAGEGDLLRMLPEFGIGTLRLAHGNELHGHWVQVIGHSVAWGPSPSGAAAFAGLDAEQLPPSLWWPVHLMLSLGRWPTALALMAAAALAAALVGHLSRPTPEEGAWPRAVRRTALALWALLLVPALLFVAWIYGLAWRPAVPGLLPFAGVTSGWVLAVGALGFTVVSLMHAASAAAATTTRRAGAWVAPGVCAKRLVSHFA